MSGYTTIQDGDLVTPAFFNTRFDELIASGLDVINVKHPTYGATGDGTTDDSSAIHSAITAASGKVVYFPAGTYRIDTFAATQLSSSFTLVGAPGAVLDGNNASNGYIDISNRGSTISRIHISGLEIKNTGAHAVRCFDGTLHSTTNAGGYTTISRFEFLNNHVHDCESGLYMPCKVQKAIVKGNLFENLTAATSVCVGVWFGANYFDSGDTDHEDIKQYIVTDNVFESIDAQTNGVEAHAIILYGREAVVSNNLVKNIVNSGNGVSAEGIYVKTRWCTITGNVLIDAGTGEGSIAVKSGRDDEGNESPPGFGNTVVGNTLHSSSGAHTGIYLQTDDVIVANNIVEGFGARGIETQPDLGYDNIAIRGNHIRNHRGDIAISLQHFGDNCVVEDNTIYDLSASQGTVTNAYGIFANVDSGDISEWVIRRNIVIDRDHSSATSSVRGITFQFKGTAGAATTATGVEISNNKIAITSSGVTEHGIGVIATDVSGNPGNYANLRVIGNDCSETDGTNQFTLFFDTDPTDAIFRDNLFVVPIFTDSGGTTVANRHCNTTFSNRTAGGSGRTYTLPAAFPGLHYKFIRANTGTLAVDVQSGEQIRGTTAAGQTVDLDAQGSVLEVRCETGTVWEVTNAWDVTFN